jgi:hypothetical protein
MNLHERIKGVKSSNPYFAKDLAKAEGCNKFIGKGTPASSTNKYRIAAGNLGNCGKYDEQDIIFVSVEGNRTGRELFPIVEIALAANANATFITDNEYHRSRPYNVGEREVAHYLKASGYIEDQGVWIRSK